jgi:hypothetical protein
VIGVFCFVVLQGPLDGAVVGAAAAAIGARGASGRAVKSRPPHISTARAALVVNAAGLTITPPDEMQPRPT